MTTLQQRREWYRFFPEGTLEFLIITRVLGLGGLLALGVAGGAYRPWVWAGVTALLWCDYLLVIWWLLQLTLDSRLASPGEGPGQHRVVLCGQAILPSLAMVALLAGLTWGRGLNWPTVLVLLVVWAGLTFIGRAALNRAGLGGGLWGLLLMIPGLHWPAVHRLSGDVAERLVDSQAEPDGVKGSRTLLQAASLVWVITIVPWLVLLALTIANTWPQSGKARFAPLCATAPAVVFAILDLAAIENVQQRFVAWLKRAGRASGLASGPSTAEKPGGMGWNSPWWAQGMSGWSPEPAWPIPATTSSAMTSTLRRSPPSAAASRPSLNRG